MSELYLLNGIEFSQYTSQMGSSYWGNILGTRKTALALLDFELSILFQSSSSK